MNECSTHTGKLCGRCPAPSAILSWMIRSRTPMNECTTHTGKLCRRCPTTQWLVRRPNDVTRNAERVIVCASMSLTLRVAQRLASLRVHTFSRVYHGASRFALTGKLLLCLIRHRKTRLAPIVTNIPVNSAKARVWGSPGNPSRRLLGQPRVKFLFCVMPSLRAQ